MAIEKRSRLRTGTPAGNPRRHRPDLLFRIMGLACLLTGAALVLAFAYGMMDGIRQSQSLTSTWHQQLAQAAPPAVPDAQPAPNLMLPVDGVDFAVRVPTLGYYAAVREGVDSTILYSGPGHYTETPWPGQKGMVGVAAHNVYWINFPQLAKGDEVDLETRYGTFKYAVTSTRIVKPDDRTVLVQGPGRHLTLTTCWPTWAGSFATQRYIIFTDQVFPVPPSEEHPGS